jgi:penicillin-binding protein 1A
VLIGCGVLATFGLRYANGVRKLTRGVGDTVFLAADGKPWFRLDEMRHDVPLSEISADLQHAVVAVEDRRFYLHPGVDPIGITRAVVRDLRSGSRAQGGSTLTQQLARTLFLSNTRTMGRKVKEASIALMIELQLTKPQILELYLNRIYLSAGVYGVEAMAEQMFRKPASKVTLPEAAMMAGLIRAPATLSPWTNYDASLKRSHVVLGLMRQQGFITEAQEAQAKAARPSIQPYRSRSEGASGWARDYLRQQFRDEFGGDNPPDWTVQTTFDRNLQGAAEQAVASGLRRMNRKGLQAAFVAVDPRNGHLLAMVGGADYRASTYNRATRAARQPGSAFKPLLYATALSRGYSPVTLLTGLSRASAPGDPEWVPKNASSTEAADALTIRDALAESNNAAAAVLIQKITAKPVLDFAGSVGLRELPDVPSLALGTGEVTPLALTSAYGAFANGGVWSVPRAVVDVKDADGDTVFATTVTQAQVMTPEVAFQMVSMLRDVVDRGTGTPARSLGVAGPVAGKTGTTNDYHDAWFIGFSTSVVAGVWVGFDQPQPIGRGAYGASIALPIWADFMKRSARVLPATEFPVPDSLEPVELCRISHQRPVDGCDVYTEYFKQGDQVPTERCSVHQGSLRQQAARAIGGFFKRLGRIFGK